MKRIYYHHRRAWLEPSSHLLIFGHMIFLAAYAVGIFVNPEQFSELSPYRVLRSVVSEYVWGSVALAAALYLLFTPMMPSGPRRLSMLIAAMVWSVNASTILLSSGWNTAVSTYGVLCLFGVLGYTRGLDHA